METLPYEIVNIILGLTGDFVGVAARTCHLWYNLVGGKKIKFSAISTVPLVIWAREQGYPWDKYSRNIKVEYNICRVAAAYGHLEVLKYARENGCSWCKDTCNQSAHNGHLEVLKYLHENGCPWDEWVCIVSVMRDHLEILKYARENGCPWTASVSGWALECKNFKLLRYLIDNGCPWTVEVKIEAIKTGFSWDGI